ncbi:serine/threonine-protein kinase [Pedococcus sp. 2YAF34]|uniref:serine/threonine-protein kinase n=1 Tax=Pedococcus sp. 2YAF34 TaxID=3233032 RepID=UPI003F95FAB7
MGATEGSEGQPGVPPHVPGYRLGDLLGAGGTGTVWAATREADGAQCAVKVVAVGTDADTSAAARELAVLGRVDVEGLVGFHEAVALGDEGAASIALVLDHVGGGSLERVVRARGRLSVGESVTVLAPVARTLAGLHALGVTHGDVSPANVLFERSGRPLLGDLGVARLAGEGWADAYGTDGFVAPEVLDGAPVGPAADVYAVGALAWYCVTGAPPGPAALRPPLESLVPDLPPAWLDATRLALRGDPEVRPTAAELALTYFDAAACEPLRLVVGTDDTSMLTHRLRNAPAPAPAPPSRQAERVGLPRAALARLLHRVRVARPGARTTRAVATTTALLLLLGTGGLMAAGTVAAPRWLSPDGRRAEPTTSQAPAGASEAPGPTPDPTRDPSPAPPSDPQLDPSAPRDRAQRLMQALSDLRARAMESRAAADLDHLDAPGSPALAADTATLAGLRQVGQSYEGVHLVVRRADATTVARGSATVEAVVDTAAYRVVTAGSSSTRAAVAGQRLRFELVWTGDRWLVARVGAVPGTG